MSQGYTKEYYLKLCEEHALWLKQTDFSTLMHFEVDEKNNAFIKSYEDFSTEIESETFALTRKEIKTYLLGGTAAIALYAFTLDWDNAKNGVITFFI